MFASDVTTRIRDLTVSIDLERQKVAFNNRSIIRVLGQKGGNDYPYILQTRVGFNAGGGLLDTIPAINSTIGDLPLTLSQALSGLTPIDLSLIQANDRTTVSATMSDDNVISIPTSGVSFYFFGIDYGATNNIAWSSNNAIVFGTNGNNNNMTLIPAGLRGSPSTDNYPVSISSYTVPAILIANCDRNCFNVYTGITSSTINGSSFDIIKMVVYYSGQFSDTNPLNAGILHIRLIRERTGSKRQWVEVTILKTAVDETPGYSIPFSALDSNGNPIDPTKRSPWDITNGTNFLLVAGTTFSNAFPSVGTSILYQSDSTGSSWSFNINRYLNV